MSEFKVCSGTVSADDYGEIVNSSYPEETFGYYANPFVVENEKVNMIKSFADLEEGWDFGVGRPSPKHVILHAISYYLQLRPLFDEDGNAFPGTDGEIVLKFYKEDNSFEIVIYEDNSIDLIHEQGYGLDIEEIRYEENIDFKSLKSYLNKFPKGADSWTYLGQSPLINTDLTQEMGLLIADAFLYIKGGYPSSMWNVQGEHPQGESVHI